MYLEVAVDGVFEEIKEINLFYLLLAQKMLRADYSVALFRLGLSSEVADALLKLSHRELMRLSDSSMVLCGLRLDDAQVLAALSSEDVVGGSLRRARMAIKLAAQGAEVLP
ncbi:MAG: flagellar transcriptional regulator FlhD [Comamonas sp.]